MRIVKLTYAILLLSSCSYYSVYKLDNMLLYKSHYNCLKTKIMYKGRRTFDSVYVSTLGYHGLMGFTLYDSNNVIILSIGWKEWVINEVIKAGCLDSSDIITILNEKFNIRLIIEDIRCRGHKYKLLFFPSLNYIVFKQKDKDGDGLKVYIINKCKYVIK